MPTLVRLDAVTPDPSVVELNTDVPFIQYPFPDTKSKSPVD